MSAGRRAGKALCATLVAAALASAASVEDAPAALRAQTVAGGLVVPWEIAFLDGRRALVTERPGRVRLFTVGEGLLRNPWLASRCRRA